MRFRRQGYWTGLPSFPPGDLPSPGMEPLSLMLPALAGWGSEKGLKVKKCVLAERGKTQGDVKRPNMNGLSQQMMEIPNFKRKQFLQWRMDRDK